MAGIKYDPQEFADFGFLTEALGSNHLITSGGRIAPNEITTDVNGRKSLPAGALVYRESGNEEFTPVKAGEAIDPDFEIYISAHSVRDANENPEIELIRHYSVGIYYNLLPGWADFTTDTQRWVREHYNTQLAKR